jgi:methyl-accepting chemotaxis protein
MELATQGRYRLYLYLHSFIIIAAGAFFAAWGVLRTVPAGLGGGYHTGEAALREIERLLLWRVALVYVVIAVLIIIATAVLHLFYSHRIAGPAHRIGLEAAKIGRGSLSGNIAFREKDNLMDMADSLNDLAAKYRNRLSAVDESLTLIETQSRTVAETIRKGGKEAELRQTAKEISDSVRKIENSLAEMLI